MVIGVLALQGCVSPHISHFQSLGVEAIQVRLPEDLAKVQGLVLPGGESTTMLHLLRAFQFLPAIVERAREIPFWGVCAGAILMAKRLDGPSVGPGQECLGIIDLTVERNAYGRQLESFTAELEQSIALDKQAIFIRAPRFKAWGKGVAVRGVVRGEAVFLEEGPHMVTAFHPELSPDPFLHEHFLKKCGA